uniref:Uncharacterized protein n=1 Tax=Klebsiella pneumoniae TaxID=573 RepID=A0A6H1PSL7_KLEPN|nr:hypothetical protein [Klebsiella pneumoniae]
MLRENSVHEKNISIILFLIIIFVPGYILYPGFMPRRILRLAENTNDRNHRM